MAPRTRRKGVLRRNSSRRRQSSTSFHGLNCSPSTKKDSVSFSCYTKDALMKIGEKWNIRHPDDTVDLSNPRETWNGLRERMAQTCHTESCWIRQSFMADKELSRELLQFSFMPRRPPSWQKNPNEWLTSTDITRVMRRYEQAYTCFNFIGPSPINYSYRFDDGKCVWEDLCNFNLEKQIKKGKTKIGIIFNTDPHYSEGSHWVSLFINLKEQYVFFMDSTGDPPQRQIRKLMSCIARQGKNLGIDIRKIICERKHQRKNTECGVYSLYSIIGQVTEEVTVKDLCDKRVPDEKMAEMRSKYFNDHL